MYNSILTNMTALKINNNLSFASNSISKSLERMSSGLKINCAKDSAADYVISSKMKNQISGMNVASNNTQQAIELLNTADSTLESMINNLNIQKENLINM